jgi:membrane protease YdiL (CAAX protease family)
MMQALFRQQPAPPWSYLTALSGFIVMFLTIIIGSTIASTLIGDTPLALIVGWCIGMTITIVYVMTTRPMQNRQIDALKIGATSVKLPIWALFALGMAILLDLISWVVVGNQTLANAELLRFTPDTVSLTGWLIVLIFLVLLQPIAEELIFRGMMFPAMSAALGGGLGFFATALFHGMFHFLAYAPPPDEQSVFVWYGFVLPFLHGIVLTGIRALTDSTRVSMVAHAMFGIFAVLKVITFA